MQAALYGTPGDNPELAAFGEGLGRFVWRHPHFWRDGEAEGFGLVVLSGMHGKNADIARAYAARDVPVLVLDAAYFRDAPGYWQVSLGGLNRPPLFDCPPGRFDALGLAITPKGGNGKGPALIALQRADDASHGLSAMQVGVWAQSVGDGVIRPHPLDADVPPLADALAGAAVVHTLCSTIGIDALLAGVPAIADMPDNAAWGELSGPDLPSVADRRRLFSRLAYGQWTLDEMRSGECAAFVRDHLLPNVPMDMPEVGTDVPELGNEPKRRGRPRKVKA
ncbi:hypothetical protein [Rhodanobacter lindaniclasticus]|uniref:Uncharacterized protein n=1 Tax=Rhodanobacter lindaniclasticus TaxID=75310 RepID=A0A4V3USB6_9GAMM|nr:hypothetical protein [Rhodanobacter lindaniclasticus]THD06111.1 hypothetical protein B1991_14295 [Rhodanobacter lindaniclasticus]